MKSLQSWNKHLWIFKLRSSLKQAQIDKEKLVLENGLLSKELRKKLNEDKVPRVESPRPMPKEVVPKRLLKLKFV